MAKGELQKNMQVEVSPRWDNRNIKVTYMECFGRLMSGISPWLALPDDDSKEDKMRAGLRRKLGTARISLKTRRLKKEPRPFN